MSLPRVLVIDDDPDFQRLFARALTEGGMVALAAFDPETGLAMAEEHSQAVVVVDGHLPGMSGLEVCRGLLGDASTRPRVVYLSAHPIPKTLTAELHALGVSLVLEKSLEPDLLVEEVRCLTRAAALQPESASPPQDAFAELKAEYLASGPAKLEALRAALQGAETRVGVEELRRLSHRTHGTGGSYGFRRLSELAGRLEELCMQGLEGRGYFADGERKAAEGLVDDIAAEFRAPSLPRRAPGEVEGMREPARPIAGTDPTRRLSLAVVDDDPDLGRKLLIEARAAKVNLSIYQRGEDALAAFAERLPDCVFVDLDLGLERGEDLVRALRRIPGGEHCPIVVFSVHQEVQDRLSSVYAGADAYLSKPVRVSDLAQAAERLYAGPRHGRFHVLFLDDSELIAQIRGELETERLEFSICSEPSAIIETLHRSRPDLVLVSSHLGPLSSADLCRLIRADARFDELPIVVLTRDVKPLDRVDIFRAGADDYLVLPLVREELVARVMGRLRRNELIRSLANKDALTGLFNRRYFDGQLALEVAVAARQGSKLTLVFLDIDHFKSVNDRFGHPMGDAVLRDLGAEMLACFRRSDLCARFGGEEFVVLMRNVDGAVCRDVLDKFRAQFSLREFTSLDATFRVTLSAGIAEFPGDAKGVDELVQAADQALYRAKRGGRNQSVLASCKVES